MVSITLLNANNKISFEHQIPSAAARNGEIAIYFVAANFPERKLREVPAKGKIHEHDVGK